MVQGASQKNNQSPETKYKIYGEPETKTRYPIVKKTGSIDAQELQYKAKEKEWYIFVNSYLVLSQIGCEHFLQEKKLTISKKYIIIAIIYNLRHSLELLIKTISRITNKSTDKNDQIHDIKKLFEKLEKSIGNEKIGKLSKSSINSLKTMVIKYQELSPLNGYIQRCFTIDDTNNTFLRYPENSAQIVVNYEKMLSQVNKDDIKGIKTDIDKLIEIMPNIKKIIG